MTLKPALWFCWTILWLAAATGEATWAQIGNQSGTNRARAGETDKQIGDPKKPIGYWNWQMSTLGGSQFWTDLRVTGGWKIQQHSESGHCRLLDPSSVRYAWGNHAHCEKELLGKIVTGKVTLPKGSVVIVLHGLMRTHQSMAPLASHLKNRGFETINFQYASTRKPIEAHARALRLVIDQLGPQVTEIYLVGHSMGNLVVRRYLHDGYDLRIKRMVMIGPPNQGSRMARLLKDSRLFQTIAGVSGMQLAVGWEKLEPKLAVPDFEFGIIAGGQESEDDFSNFVLTGKDDFTVSVEETKLPGASDLMVRPLLHSNMMKNEQTLEATERFFKFGYFSTESNRNPIPKHDSRK
ncbi:MAG: alpha/beta fold hydrolase [Planctomycetota bacterium]